MHSFYKKAYKMLSVTFSHCKMEEKIRMVLETIPVKIIHINTTKLFFLSTNYDLRDENNWENFFTQDYVQKATVWCSVFLTSVLFVLRRPYHMKIQSVTKVGHGRGTHGWNCHDSPSQPLQIYMILDGFHRGPNPPLIRLCLSLNRNVNKNVKKQWNITTLKRFLKPWSMFKNKTVFQSFYLFSTIEFLSPKTICLGTNPYVILHVRAQIPY